MLGSRCVSEREIVETAFGRPAVVMEHVRQRLDGELGIVLRDDHVVAVSAYRLGLRRVSDLPLPRLERLDVGGNGLHELRQVPPSVRELYVYDNQLERLPALPRLRVLDANRNRLVELPELHGVDFVYAAENRLVAPPPMMGCRYANFSGNRLERLPHDPAIEELRLENAGLVTLPTSIRALEGLRELSLRGNALTALPDEIGELSRLRVLDLRGNQLETLPESLARLRLTKLDLRWNPLSRRPAWLDEPRDTVVYT